jgi:hypothetical protein
MSSSFAAEESTQTLECEYAGDFEQCSVAHKNGSTRNMTDPICSPNPDAESILDQIILDTKFREIDEEAQQYLIQLSKDKDKYF